MIQKIQKNLSRNMLLYTFLVIASGTALGWFFDLKLLSDLILPVVLIMIYPMMVNLSLLSMKKIRGSSKPLIEAIILNFIYAPALMYVLTSIFISDPQITLALMLLSIAPASSMGLGYIGLAEGHMVSGTIIVAAAFLLSIIAYPVFGHYLAAGADISVPTGLLLKNLLIVLVIPLLLGVITREYIERRHGQNKFLKAKPYFATTTLFFLYVLIFIIFSSKAALIIKHWPDIFLLLPIAIFYYGITIFFTLYVNKKILKLDYGHHQSVVFTSVSKNIALTIAILIAVFGKAGQYMAIFPAIMSLFQAPFLMIYLKSSHHVKRHFGLI
ncbi:MAG: arsenic resistance protein [Actinobacteria bacterium]|nr:arsenic resistance protein [Actinomycetota bacterium]